MSRQPLPPFCKVSALKKVRAAEDAWTGRDPIQVSLAYTPIMFGGTGPSFYQAERKLRRF